jgi:hypothetical protein
MRTKAKPAAQFGVCIDNRGYAASLELGKLYRVVPDEEASKHGYTRVVDESGEDYGYSAERFVILKAPPVVHALSGRKSHRPKKVSQPIAPTVRRARLP